MKTRLIAVLFAASTSLILPSCLEHPPGSEWQRPPRYGHGGTETSRKPKTKKPTSQPTSRKPQNRFGYSGDDDNRTPPSNSGPSTSSRDRDVKPISSSGNQTNDTASGGDEKPAVEKPGGAPAPGDMPFARGVPGDPLHVRLPGREDLPKISIEQGSSGKPLPPGTPVSIADPNNPGKEIYFKVP